MCIGVIKRAFGLAKVRYRGLKKNTHRLLMTCALANRSWRVAIYCDANGALCVRNQASKHRVDTPIRPDAGPNYPILSLVRRSICLSSMR
jgi:hypothetical protein